MTQNLELYSQPPDRDGVSSLQRKHGDLMVALELDENFLSMWGSIHNATTQNTHPNLAQLDSYQQNCTIGGYTFYTFYYRHEDAEPIEKALKAEPFGQFDRAYQVEWLEDLCSAISHLHDHGIIHGDIKPSNILVGDDGFVVIDYETAQKINCQNSLPGIMSRYYSAPELESPLTRIAPSIDIYSLGKTISSLLSNGASMQPAPNPELAAILRSTTEFDPRKRPQSVPEFWGELQSALLKSR